MFNGEVVKEYTEEEMQVPNIRQQINELVESGKITEEGGSRHEDMEEGR